MPEAEALVLWPQDVKSRLTGKDPGARKNWGHEEKGMTEDEMVGWHHRLNGHEFKQTDSEGHRSLVCCSPWVYKESETTERLINNKNQTFRECLQRALHFDKDEQGSETCPPAAHSLNQCRKTDGKECSGIPEVKAAEE